MTPSTTTEGPLDRVRVLDLCDPKGQYMGRLLGSHGADVIKVEPTGGDAGRRIGPFVDDVAGVNRSLFWWYYNADKRSIAIDLSQPDGAALVRQLAQDADVLLESFAPGKLAELGLDYAALSADHPQLVMTSLTPFGQDGPRANWTWSDAVGLALGGPMSMCGYDDLPAHRRSGPLSTRPSTSARTLGRRARWSRCWSELARVTDSTSMRRSMRPAQ